MYLLLKSTLNPKIGFYFLPFFAVDFFAVVFFADPALAVDFLAVFFGINNHNKPII